LKSEIPPEKLSEKENILIFGTGEQCLRILDIILAIDRYTVCGFIDSELEIGKDYAGFKILGRMSDLPLVLTSHKVDKGIIAFENNFIRYEVAAAINAAACNFEFVSAIHPSAILGRDVKISDGCVIMPNVVINIGAELGKHCLMKARSSLDHDSYLSDYSSLGVDTTAGGNVKIGQCTTIANGVSIVQNIAIGNHSVVSAGSLVVDNLGDNILVSGVPAKEIGKQIENIYDISKIADK